MSARIAITPNNAGVHNNRGIALCDANRPEAPVACFEAAIAVDRDYFDAHLNLANALRRLSSLRDSGRAQFAEAIGTGPRTRRCVRIMRDALHFLRRYEAAVASFDRALALDPTFESRGGRAAALPAAALRLA